MFPLLLLLLLFFSSSVPVQSFHKSTLSDENALLAFKKSLLADPLNSLHNWNGSESLCSWRGVICSARPNRAVRVVSLSLAGMGLAGPISPFLGNLSFLRVLDLKNNSFDGQIPYQLGGLSRLRILRLSYNFLSGSIPSEFVHLPNLQKLGLGANQLTGTIPAFTSKTLTLLDLGINKLQGSIPSAVALLPNLEIIEFDRNQLTGTIPAFSSKTLTSLDLTENRLHGSIPSQLALLPNLEAISFDRNQLTGTIPPFLGNLSSLFTLSLRENRFHGPIPVELASLTQLEWLGLGMNNLTGEIPTALTNCSNLQTLDLGDNNLFGHIPWEFGIKFSQLQGLYLRENLLTGSIPISLANCTGLQFLELSANQLSGPVPIELGNLHQLKLLNLQQNQLDTKSSTLLYILTALTNCTYLNEIYLGLNLLTGVLPSTIGQLSSELTILDLSSNEIEGNIPDEIGNLTNLNFLDLSGNSFNGTIPSGLQSLSRLERLYVNKNNLQGRIPNDLGQLKSLGALDLSENMLSENIPDSLGQLSQLRQIYLDHNQLLRQVPADLGRCLKLEILDLSYNKLTGKIPPEVAGLPNLQIYLNLSHNFLQGSLPSEMSKIVMVQAIDVSSNNLSGEIPSVLESCIALQYMNLSWNTFQGPIPASLVNLKNLEDMDLSYNQLNGTIPVAFEKFKMLKHLNFSSNKLTGEVPRHGIFSTLGASAVMDNPGICGKWIGFPPCSHSKHRKQWFLKKVLLPIMIGIAFVIMCILLILIWWRQKYTSPDASALKFGPTRILYRELIDATSGFSEANLLGIGSFGSVYRGILNNGTNIAVKVINLQDENVHHSFSRECNVLKRVRHRNVIRIISTCSTDDFKALILPFMANGSLERWLHPDEEECKLNLCERLRIAIEIAQGMEYLHHDCFVQVLHCDLKPSNVLLGDDMTVYLADFGISKLIFGNSISSLSSTNALKGSIGYLAPEYGTGGKVWTKGDVYSYGIILLELMTRRRPIDDIFVEGMDLSKWVRINFQRNITDVVDSNLLTDVNESYSSRVLECITQVLQVGLVCASESPQERPNMKEIVKRLDTIKHTFLGMPRTFELPVDISSLLKNTSGQNKTRLESDESWSTSTT